MIIYSFQNFKIFYIKITCLDKVIKKKFKNKEFLKYIKLIK